MKVGRVYASALAKYVHASHLRHKATGRVRAAEVLYDRVFPNGRCLVEEAHDGTLRLLSPDENMCINVTKAHEGELFRYAI